MIRDILKSFTKQRTAMAAGYDALDHVRAEIAEKVREIEVLRSAPRPVAEALSLFDAWADEAATAAIDRLPIHRLLDSRNPAPSLETEILRMPGEITPNTRPDVEMLVGILFFVGRDRLREVIAGQLGDLVAGREALKSDERAERISAAQAELLHLHLVEEQLVRQMQESGLSVSRRADAPAIALLADDASLPG
ncbi:MAG: hypothetical protein JNN06_16545 [Gemmobacter sp.]|uniref:hypothetical protein n=1 Tax=Gemmobacter sp. TaxID=1898957 RepID=UPI001A51D9B9|nr:hypothetical protein [Gemmobacter sp.]MBL8563878.1 hypothetical protein [Gemmobacter sp.]